MTVRTVEVRRDPSAPPVTHLDDYESFCGTAEPASGDVPDALTPTELRALLDGADPPALVDVREAVEWDIGHLDGATLIPLGEIESGSALHHIPRDRPVVLYCKTGIRSGRALQTLRDAGLTDVRHLDGGIAAWAREIDPSLPRY